MKNNLLVLLFITFFALVMPERARATGACTCGRFNDQKDNGCKSKPGRPGEPGSDANNPGSNMATCETCPSVGMPRWWVSEPEINLFIADEPLSYTTSSGDKMAFRFNHKQRFELPEQDRCPSYYSTPGDSLTPRGRLIKKTYNHYGKNQLSMTNAAWGNNWMMDILFWDTTWEKNNVPPSSGVWTRRGIPFSAGYEALVFRPEGGIYYFTQTGVNPPTDPVSQVVLTAASGKNYPTTIDPVTNIDGIYWGDSTNGFRMVYPDGSQDVFGFCFYQDGSSFSYPGDPSGLPTTASALLTQRIDPQGRTTRVGYEKVSFTNAWGDTPTISYRIRYIVDADGLTNRFIYQTSGAVNAWQVTEIDDPFGRKATFGYEAKGAVKYTGGRLSSITDAAGLTNSFTYAGDNGWIKTLTTPYGTNTFTYSEVADATVTNGFSSRSLVITEPEGTRQKYAYIHSSPSLKSMERAPVLLNGQPSTFDDGKTGGTHDSLQYRNSFYWNASQMEKDEWNLEIARMRHWLLDPSDGVSISDLISSERDPSPDDGQTEGLRTWYDYTNKPQGSNELAGSQLSCIGRVLPDGTNQYIRYWHTDLPTYKNYTAESYTKPDGTMGERTNSFLFDSKGVELHNKTTATEEGAISSNFSYNYLHQVTNVFDSLNQKTVYQWDDTTHNLTGISYPNGQSIDLVYVGGRLQQANFSPQGRTITIDAYTNSLPAVVEISGTGIPTLGLSYTYDGLNRRTSTRFADGTTISNVYRALDIVAQKDRLNHWTYFQYDRLQHLKTITNALNNVRYLTWCDCGSLESFTDAAGINTNSFNHNNQGLLTGATYPDKSTRTFYYDLASRLTNVVDGSGRWTKLFYNNQGLVTNIVNAYGPLQQIAYDSFDRPIRVRDASGVRVTNTFDVLDRLVSRQWPNGGVEGFGYSTNGLIAYTNRDSQVTRYGRDAAGRLTAMTNNVEVVQYGYDAMDHLVSLVDGLNHTTTWRYNEYGQMFSKLDTLNNEMLHFTYDAAGQLTNRWTPEKGNTAYSYDSVGNLKTVTYPQSAINFNYDPANQLTNMVDAVGTNQFTYTASGQLQSEDGPWGNDTVTYGYTEGHRTSLTLNSQPSALNASYGYDDAWRLKTLTSPAGAFGYSYATGLASPLPAGLSLPNFATISKHYNTLGALDSTALANVWGHVLDGYNYTSDLLGLRTNITRSLGLTTNHVALGYDSIGQLVKWNGLEPDATPRLNEQLGYGYDAAGNLHYRTNNALIQTFTPNSINQMATAGRSGTLTISGAMPVPASVTVNGQPAQTNSDLTFASPNNALANGQNSFTLIAQNAYGVKATNNLSVNLPVTLALNYDLNGNLTNDGLRSFSYDAENQLTNVAVAYQWRANFAYDGMGRRRISREYAWVNNAWSLTNEIHYVYDNMLVIQERDASNSPLVTYTRGLDLSGSREGAGGIGGLLARTDAKGTAFYHADGAGNVTALMDSQQHIVARYLYDPYGKQLGQWGPMANANRYRFSSKEIHPNSGLYYYGYRFYEPNFQRWLNRDPIGEEGGMNLYGYVGNNPINKVDLLGLIWVYSDLPPGVQGPPNAYWVDDGGLQSTDFDLLPVFLPEIPAVGKALGLVGDALGNTAKAAVSKFKKCPVPEVKPPGWTPDWEKGISSRSNTGKPGGESWWDPEGGEWHRHEPDSWHPDAHWDHNPWDNWTAPWKNIDDKGNIIP